jgi:hemerythrin
MPIFAWNDSYSVKIMEFDGHHKQLINLINQLHDAMGQGQGQKELGVILNNLIEYTKFHFAAEEKLFTRFNYTASTVHRAQHDALTKKVLELQAEQRSGKIGLSVKVIDFLKDWLTNHILKEDKAYSAFFNAQGVH